MPLVAAEGRNGFADRPAEPSASLQEKSEGAGAPRSLADLQEAQAPELTIGAGRANATGRRLAVDMASGVVAGAKAVLDAQPDEVDAWFAPACWRRNHRSQADWESALGCASDVDWHDDAGKHAPVPPAAVETLTAAWLVEPPEGNLFYWTPRGFRIVVLFDRVVRDAGELQAFKIAFALALDAWLERRGIAAKRTGRKARSGFAVDRATLDLARMFYRPRSTVDGIHRDEPVVVIRDHPYDPISPPRLVGHATPAPMKAPPRTAPSVGFEAAISAFNAANPGNWPSSAGTCPACGHTGCFGTLPGNAARWTCFSANHEVDSGCCGIEGQGCWHGDALDLAARGAGLTREELLRRDGYLPDTADAEDPAASRSGTRSLADKIVDLVVDRAELWHTPEGVAYADFLDGARRETWALQSAGFRRQAKKLLYQECRRAPSAQAIADSIGMLEAVAVHEGPEHPVFVRVASFDDKVYVDLCNRAWEAVEVSSAGWRIVADAPARFRRAPGMRALPTPVSGGSVEDLRSFLNVASDDDFRLIIVWLVAALMGRGPFVIVIVQGEQGSGKTTRSRVLVALVDPSQSDLRSLPGSERDLAIAANNKFVVGFDNLSGMKEWQADALCRLATGGGFSTRLLFSNDEEVIFDLARPQVANGIPDLATRADLADRSVVLQSPSITRKNRIPDNKFWEGFAAAHPRLLGALLDTLSGALRTLPTVTLQELPRMADFAMLGVAVEQVLGWPSGSFMRAYDANRASGVGAQLSADPVVATVTDLFADTTGWTGTPTALYEELCNRASEHVRRSVGWPRCAQTLSNQLRRLEPALRSAGISVTFDRTAQKRLISIQGNPTPMDDGSQHAYDDAGVHDARDAGDAGGPAGAAAPLVDPLAAPTEPRPEAGEVDVDLDPSDPFGPSPQPIPDLLPPIVPLPPRRESYLL